MVREIAYQNNMNGNDVKKILGSSLREIRIARGLTQEKLAELIGVQPNSINRIENGAIFVKCDTLAKLSNALNVHPGILLTARPQVVLKEHIDSMRAITELLQTFSQDKLKEVYDILSVMKK